MEPTEALHKVSQETVLKALRILNDMVSDRKARSIISLCLGNSKGNEFDEPVIYAYRNKITLLLFQLGPSNLREPRLNLYSKLLKQREGFLRDLIEILNVLNKAEIEYAIFKMKPVPDAPVDIDILLPSWNEIKSTLKVLKRAFERVLIWNVDKYSMGVWVWLHGRHEVVDLYVAPHASDMIYLDGNILLSNTVETRIEGCKFRILSPEAEAVTLVAHSVYKEQMVTLSDAISVLSYTLMSNHDKLSELIGRILNPTCLNTFYLTISHAPKFPAHIPLKCVIPLAMLLTLNTCSRQSLPYFIHSALNKRSRFVRTLLDHSRRETYVRGFR